jgi:hypothetical protein
VRPAVPPDVESRPADGPDDQSVTSSARADPPSADGQSAPNLSPRQKRLASKAAYRARRSADEALREKERERVKAWRLQNRDKTRAQKQKARSANYHRPFVAIDSEGQDYSDDGILYDGVRHAQHATYLWGAAADDGRRHSGCHRLRRGERTRSRSARPRYWIGFSMFRAVSARPSTSCFRSATT